MPVSVPSLLVVDANILFSFFKKDSSRRRLIEELPHRGCRMLSPSFALEELLNNRERIMEFAGISPSGFMFLLSLLERKINVVPVAAYEDFLDDAAAISPHGEHVRKDDPYFALALSHDSPIWSEETAFKEQSRVPVFSTSELLELL
ncbi:MAG: PIN domain-containing protein [Thermoplasmatota archaeon]